MAPMNLLHVQQVAASIEDRFRGHLDLSNAGSAPPETVLRTRGLAALAVQMLTGEEPANAAASVTDCFDDNGVDALFIDEATPRLILVQSKWHDNPRRGITLGDAHRFMSGMRAITDERFDRFNGLLDADAPRISAVLRHPLLRLDLVVVTTGNVEFGQHVRLAFDDECQAMNEPDEILHVRLIKLEEIHQYVLDTAAGATIDLTALLEHWGVLTEPYEACYGTMSAGQIVGWYRRFGDRLFSRNIRKALGMTQVNQRLVGTLVHESKHFWYFNNGLTILCEQIKRAPVGAPHRRRGEFKLSGVSVVNGAQTVVSLAEAAQLKPNCVENARVWVRVISLEDCPEAFAAEVTRATNTQNHIIDRDFVALDPLQERLSREFSLTLRKTYVAKRGEPIPNPDDGCTVQEATAALACAQSDTRYAVLVRSNPGALWDTTDVGMYRTVFQPSLTATAVWRWVSALRRVDSTVAALVADLTGRARAVAGQGDRLAAHIVFGALDQTGIDDPLRDWDDQLDRVDELAATVVCLLIDHAQQEFADTYVPTLFKSVGKSRQLVALVRTDLDAGRTGSEQLGPIKPSTTVAAESRREGIAFHLSKRGVSARGHLHGTGFVVRAGSLAAATAVPSLRTNPNAVTRREWLIAEGVLREPPDQPRFLVLTRDEYFDSPSQASAVMLGRPSNGRTDWRTADGLSLNQALLEGPAHS